MEMLQTVKARLRKDLLKKREDLSLDEIKKQSRQKVDKLYKLFADFLEKEQNNIQSICAYYPLAKEVDLRAFYEDIISAKYGNIKLFFPRVNKKEMDFYEIKSFEDLEKGCFSVMEPKEYCKRIKDMNNSFVIVPCVGINKEGARIGYGAGYYDKYFANKKNNYFVGITYDFAMNLDFIADTFDIKMDTVL